MTASTNVTGPKIVFVSPFLVLSFKGDSKLVAKKRYISFKALASTLSTMFEPMMWSSLTPLKVRLSETEPSDKISAFQPLSYSASCASRRDVTFWSSAVNFCLSFKTSWLNKPEMAICSMIFSGALIDRVVIKALALMVWRTSSIKSCPVICSPLKVSSTASSVPPLIKYSSISRSSLR